VMIEAMACGTPVIAYRRGSVPEVLDHGWTGFIVDDIAGASTAVAEVDRLDRRMIRTRFEQRFTAERMAKGYVAVYEGRAAVLAMPVTTPLLGRATGDLSGRDGDVRGAAHAA
jgi:glycosyltransferase involved in cell wall biosynthesis